MKANPNYREYLKSLQRMTPEDRLMRAFELSAIERQRIEQDLRTRFPNLAEQDFRLLLLRELHPDLEDDFLRKILSMPQHEC